MADTKHTPGPWLAAAKPSSVVGWPVVAPHAMGRSICNVTVHDEAEANAWLIKAAPDLLAMLKVAQLWLDVDGRYDMRGINAAIAKAEGRADG